MRGAIHHKIVVWHTGLWGEEGGGWYYDLLHLAASLAIFATRGGAWAVVA